MISQGNNEPHSGIRRTTSLVLYSACLMIAGTLQLVSQAPVASSGTDFIANLPRLYLDTRAEFLLTITAVEDATVTVLQNATGTTESRRVSAGESWHYRIPRSEIGYPVQEEGRSRRSLRIRSTAAVTVHAAHDGDYVTDSWLIPPVRDLGRDYIVTSVWSASTTGGVVTIAATEPNTTVRVTPSVPTPRGGAPGFSYGVTLDSGEVWQIVPTVPEFSDLTGTRITADRPVLVLGGHAGTDLLGRGAYNPMIEWHPPIDYLGTEHVGRPFPLRRDGIYKVVAYEDGTILWVNNAPVDTLDAGEHRRWYDPFPVYFRTSNPALIAQFLDHTRDSLAKPQDGDPSMTFLQPVRVWNTSYRWTTLDLPDRINNSGGNSDWIPFRHYLMISADFSEGVHPVYLDGRDISNFLTSNISGTGYYIGWITIDSGTHNLTAERPVSLQSFGFNSYDAYGHPVGFPPPPMVEATGSIDSTCAEDYSTNLFVRNRSDETVIIDSVLAGGENLAGDPVGTEVQPGREHRLTYLRSLKTTGFFLDTVVLRLRNLRTGRVTVVESRVRVERIVPELTVQPDSIAFPVATPDEPTTSTTVEVTNTGRLELDIERLDLPPGISLISPSLPTTLPPGTSITLRLNWRPTGFPDSVGGGISIHTSPCDLESEIPATATADVDREPELAADTLFLLCGENSPEQRFIISNGTLFVVQVDSVELDLGLIPVDLPRGRRLESGESVSGYVQWNVEISGESKRLVRIWVNGRPEPRVLELVAIRRTLGFGIIEDIIDLGDVPACGPEGVRFSIEIANNGDVPLPGLSLLHSGDISVMGEASLVGLEPGQSTVISGAISRTDTGRFSEPIILTDSLCGIADTVTLTGNLRRGFLVPIDSAVSVSGALGCDFPATRRIDIFNRGNSAEEISAVLPGSQFWSINGGQIPMTINAFDTVSIELSVSPPAVGTMHDTILLITAPCGDTLRVPIEVVSDSPAWVALDTVITLDSILPGIPASVRLGIQNTGTRPIPVEEVVFSETVPGLSIDSSDGGSVILPGGTLTFTLMYNSDDPVRTETSILLIGPDCIDTLRIPVRLEPGTVDLFLELVGREGRVDDVVELTLVAGTPIQLPDPVAIDLTIGFARSGLLPTGLHGSIEIDADTIVLEDVTTRALAVSYEGIPERDLDTIGSVDVRLLLAERTEWPITLSGTARMIDTTGVNVRLHLSADSVSVWDLCQNDGMRLITLRPGVYLGQLRPNPTSADVEVSVISTREGSSDGTLIITNIIGMTLHESTIEIVPGLNRYRFDLSAQPPGRYLVRIEAGDRRLTGSVMRQ